MKSGTLFPMYLYYGEMIYSKIKSILIIILVIICEVASIIFYKFELKNSNYNDIFLPSIAIKSCIIDTEDNELDYQNIDANMLNNVNYYFINSSNFDVLVTLFIAVNGLPKSYNIDNRVYNAT